MKNELLEQVLHKLNKIDEELIEMKANTVTVENIEKVSMKVETISDYLFQTEEVKEQEFNYEVLDALFD